MLMIRKINELIGKTLVNIENIDDEELIFECSNGEKYKMYHKQDSCECVGIDDVIGNLVNLLRAPLIIAEESTDEGDTDWGTCTWTFYKFATNKGQVIIRWYGESDGCSSESVNIEKMN